MPLAALAILSTLFLVARTIDPSDAIKFTDLDVEDRLRDPRMTAPTYAGVTSDGAVTDRGRRRRTGRHHNQGGGAIAL